MERVFQIFDKDDSGSISFQEFLDAMHQFAGQTPDDKIKFLFKVYDIDGKGLNMYNFLTITAVPVWDFTIDRDTLQY